MHSGTTTEQSFRHTRKLKLPCWADDNSTNYMVLQRNTTIPRRVLLWGNLWTVLALAVLVIIHALFSSITTR